MAEAFALPGPVELLLILLIFGLPIIVLSILTIALRKRGQQAAPPPPPSESNIDREPPS